MFSVAWFGVVLCNCVVVLLLCLCVGLLVLLLLCCCVGVLFICFVVLVYALVVVLS